MTNNLTEALQIIIHYHQPAQKYMHFPRQLNLDKLHRDSLTKHGLTAAASDLVMFLQSGFDVYRYYSKCQAVHNKMHAYFYGKKHATSYQLYGQHLFVFVCITSYQSHRYTTFIYSVVSFELFFVHNPIMFEHVFCM